MISPLGLKCAKRSSMRRSAVPIALSVGSGLRSVRGAAVRSTSARPCTSIVMSAPLGKTLMTVIVSGTPAASCVPTGWASCRSIVRLSARAPSTGS